MESSDVRIDITLRLETALTEFESRQVLRTLGALDGIGTAQLSGTGRRELQVSFDPYCLSGRDILKWLAQHTIKAQFLRSHQQSTAS